MQFKRSIGAMLALTALLMAVPSGASAARAVPGGKYTGKTNQGEDIYLNISSDGSRFVPKSRIFYPYLCNGAGRVKSTLLTGVAIKSDGTFSVNQSTPQRTLVLSGRFINKGKKVRGTLRRTAGCQDSGQVTFVIPLRSVRGQKV